MQMMGGECDRQQKLSNIRSPEDWAPLHAFTSHAKFVGWG